MRLLLLASAILAVVASDCNIDPSCVVPAMDDGTPLALNDDCTYLVPNDGNMYNFCMSGAGGDLYPGLYCNWKFVGPSAGAKVRITVQSMKMTNGGAQCQNTPQDMVNIAGTASVMGKGGNLCRTYNTTAGNSNCDESGNASPVTVQYFVNQDNTPTAFCMGVNVQPKPC